MTIKSIVTIKQEFEKSIKYKKCHKCGCQQITINAIENHLEHFDMKDRSRLLPLIRKAVKTFKPIEYDCLKCKVCYPVRIYIELKKAYPSI